MALIFLAGLAAAALCKAIKLPRIIGMLLCGIAAGPFVLNLLNPSILNISAPLGALGMDASYRSLLNKAQIC